MIHMISHIFLPFYIILIHPLYVKYIFPLSDTTALSVLAL